MRVLVIGSGAREHALVWKIMKSSSVKKIYAAPGNGGICRIAECVQIDPIDIHGLVSFALAKHIDLSVVGPEVPLVAGIVDEFKRKGLDIFGPTKAAARLEGSKVFAKQIMQKYNIPTADFAVFNRADQADKYLTGKNFPLVIKADGLAAGKGVVIAKSKEAAKLAIKQIMEDKVFKSAGERIIIEECLSGEEVSIITLCDGNRVVSLVSSQDHKRIYDKDQGPNTGGMGAYSPAPIVTKELLVQIEQEIIRPTIAGMAKEGIPYHGVLYTGLMLTDYGPKVLEFNVRFGDPETQVALPLLKSDLVELMENTISGSLAKISLEWEDAACVGIVLASGGYPGSYRTGDEIKGLEFFKNKKDIFIFHAGTKFTNGKFLTAGGRVLSVVAKDKELKPAVDKAYQAVEQIKFTDMHYRRDIAWRAIV
ncbi:MAG: phosphoribosylamine--glycine ligase [Candidatus Omnitrophota bacterium]